MKFDGYLPWQQSQWQNIINCISTEKMPHAIMLSGVSGIGKIDFARFLAAYLLCSKKLNGDMCGVCHNCKLLKSDTHPDFKFVQPESEGKAIRVDQIRELATFFTMSSQLSGYKAAIIYPADKMNRNAANSLLKTLEEPSSRSVMILVTERPASLPATVRSRCQVIDFAIPDKEQALTWLSDNSEVLDKSRLELALRLAAGKPFEAINFLNEENMQLRVQEFSNIERIVAGKLSPMALAEKWSKANNKVLLEWLSSWVNDMILIKQAADSDYLINQDIYERISRLSAIISLKRLYEILDSINDAARFIDRQANLQLLFENMLLLWQKN